MKRTFLAMALAGSVPFGRAYAQKSPVLGVIGVNYSFFSAHTGDLGVTGVVGQQNHPFQITAKWDFGNNGGFGASVDWLFVRYQIAQTPLWWYAGVGAGIGIRSTFNLGARVPVAIQWFPIKRLETSLEVSPGVKLLTGVAFDFGLTIGVRSHFAI